MHLCGGNKAVALMPQVKQQTHCKLSGMVTSVILDMVAMLCGELATPG